MATTLSFRHIGDLIVGQHQRRFHSPDSSSTTALLPAWGTTAGQRPSYALLVDAENALAASFDLAMEDIEKRGIETPIRRIFGKPVLLQHDQWQTVIRNHSCTPIYCHRLVDLDLAVNAMDLLYMKKHFLRGFVLFSSDSDFTSLVQRIREDNVTVLGIGQRGKINAEETLPKACHEYVYTEDLERAEVRRVSEERVRAMENAKREAELIRNREVEMAKAMENAKLEAEQKVKAIEDAKLEAEQKIKAIEDAKLTAVEQEPAVPEVPSNRYNTTLLSLQKAFQNVWGAVTVWKPVIAKVEGNSPLNDDECADAGTIKDDDKNNKKNKKNKSSSNNNSNNDNNNDNINSSESRSFDKNDTAVTNIVAANGSKAEAVCAAVVQTLRKELKVFAPNNEWIYLAFLIGKSSCDLGGTGYLKMSKFVRAHPDDFELRVSGTTTLEIRLRELTM
jgi:NYN domain